MDNGPELLTMRFPAGPKIMSKMIHKTPCLYQRFVILPSSKRTLIN